MARCCQHGLCRVGDMAPTCRHVGRFRGEKSLTRRRHYQPSVRRVDDDNVVQTMMPAAACGPFLAVLTQWVCRMDPLASSCRSVPADTAREAVGTWAAQRRFGWSTARLLVLVTVSEHPMWDSVQPGKATPSGKPHSACWWKLKSEQILNGGEES